MGYELPETINPDTITFCITVPDEDIHLRAFWGAMWTLTRAYNWANDDEHTALEVATVWRDLWFLNHDNWRERECMDDPCCPDEINILTEIRDMMRAGMTVRFNAALSTPPDTTAGNCAPAFFDHDTDDAGDTLLQREKALCITVERYVKAVLLVALIDMGAPAVLVDWVGSQLPEIVPQPLMKLTVVYPSVLSGLAAFFEAITGGIELDIIVCMMLDALTGDTNNTFQNFKSSVPDDVGDVDELFLPLFGLVRATNGVKQNYILFNEALELANEEDLSAFECPCEDPTTDGCGDTPIDLVIWVGDGSSAGQVITPLGDNLFRFEQTNQSGLYYVVSFKDSTDRCLLVETTDDTQGGIVHSTTLGCTDGGDGCDDADFDGAGGFAPKSGQIFAWQSGDVVNTIYRITCCS